MAHLFLPLVPVWVCATATTVTLMKSPAFHEAVPKHLRNKQTCWKAKFHQMNGH